MACTVEEIVLKVQYVLGMPSEEVLPEAILTMIVESYVPYYDLTDHCCELAYFSTIAAIEFMIRKLGNSGEGLGGSRREEKEDTTQIKQEFNGDGIVDFWRDELKRFKDDPTKLLPCMREVFSENTNTGYLIIGGVSKKEVERVDSDLDSYTAIDEAFEDLDYQIGLPNRRLRG